MLQQRINSAPRNISLLPFGRTFSRSRFSLRIVLQLFVRMMFTSASFLASMRRLTYAALFGLVMRCTNISAQSINGLSVNGLPTNGLPHGVRIIESSQIRLVLEYTPELKGFDTLQVQGRTTIQPRIKGTIATGKDAGTPVWLQVQMPVSVPSAEGFRIAEQSASSVESHSALMSPRREFLRLKARRNESPYFLNEAAYSQNASANSASPLAWTELHYNGIGRDRHIATLTLRAARFNAERGTIEIPKRIRIAIDFDASANSSQSASILGTAASEQSFSHSINDRASAAWRVVPTSPAFETLQKEILQTPPAIATPPAAPSSKQGAQTHAAEGRWMRIGVEREGIYRITAQQLREAGMTITAQELSSVRLFGNGGAELSERVSDSENNRMNEQAIFTETDASGNLTTIVFYGAAPNGFIYKDGKIQHFVNTFSKRNFYLLNVGSSQKGLRALFAESPANPVATPTSYIARIFRDDDKFNPFDASGDGSGRRWFGDRLTSGSVFKYDHALPNLVTSSAPVIYRAAVAWNNPANAGLGGQIFLKENNRDLMPVPINLQGASYDYDVGEVKTVSATLPASSIRNGRTSLEFLYVSNSANGDSYGAVDWYEIHYPRSFVAIDNQLDFFAEPEAGGRFGVTEYAVSGFTSGEQVYIVDATNRANPQFIRNINTNRLAATFRTVTDNNNPPRRFYLSSQTLSAASLEMSENADLRATAATAELLIITDKELKTSADAYRSYRQTTGVSARVVTTEQIYNEFNGGTPDPTAIRDFIAYTFRAWAKPAPRYVLLWGDGHFDYRSLDPTNKPKNFVPTYQIYDADGYMNSVNTNYMTEDYFVQVFGDDAVVDMALGRLCVRSNAEGELMLSKIRQYESTGSSDNWRSQITLIADDGPTTSISNTDRSLHTGQSEALANSFIPPDVRARKIYMADYPTENVPGGRRRPAVTQDMVAAVNEGTVILNWIGHGNPRLWAHENIFVKDIHIPQFTNLDRLFFLVAATCDFARFDNLREQSGAEEMISSARGGAIGTFAASRTVYALDNAAISQALYEQIFINTNGLPSPRIGEAFFRVKQLFYTGSFQNDLKFCLLGDPTLRLALPAQRVVLENFNGASAQDSLSVPQVKALSNVTLSGFVAAPTTSQADAGFVGNIVCNLYDSDIQKAAIDVDADRSVHNFTTLGGLLSIGSAPVQNGRFTMSFTVPKDISFSNKSGRLFLYAASTDGKKYGRGMTARFTVGGVNEDAVNDGKGPEIRIFMDARTFRAGDIVDSTPRLIADLYDATGINASGAGIGHDIQCWIDDNPIPINLTSSFRVSLTDARRGEVNRVLSKLAPGQHRVRVRAWDVFNNYSEAETNFRVGSSSGLVLTDVLNYPNPFVGSTTIRFRHNQLTAQPYVVTIANVAGVLVRRFVGATTARTMEILWDGKNENGINVGAGTYLYRVDLTGVGGQTLWASGLMMLAP